MALGLTDASYFHFFAPGTDFIVMNGVKCDGWVSASETRV